MTDYVPVVVALIAASPAYVKILYDLFNKDKAEEKAMRNALAALVKSTLIDTMEKACEKGYTTVEESDSVLSLYDPYIVFGFNGTIKNLYSKYKKLEVRSHEYQRW